MLLVDAQLCARLALFLVGVGHAAAMFEWIEGCYNPVRRHTSIGNLAPAEFEALHTTAVTAA